MVGLGSSEGSGAKGVCGLAAEGLQVTWRPREPVQTVQPGCRKSLPKKVGSSFPPCRRRLKGTWASSSGASAHFGASRRGWKRSPNGEQRRDPLLPEDVSSHSSLTRTPSLVPSVDLGEGVGAGISFVPGSALGDTAENKVNMASALIKIPVLGGSKCEPSHTTSAHPAPRGCQR